MNKLKASGRGMYIIIPGIIADDLVRTIKYLWRYAGATDARAASSYVEQWCR